MSLAQKVICGCGLSAVILLVVFPPWQQAYKSLNATYRKDLGHSFILKPPSPVEVPHYFDRGSEPSSAFYVFIGTEQLMLQCAGVMLVTLALFFSVGMLRAGSGDVSAMDHLRFVPRIATAALVIGFTTEAVILFTLTRAWSSSANEPPWADWLLKWTQEPGKHFAVYLAHLLHPGFEEGVGYFLVILFLVQGVVYGFVAYLLLMKTRKNKKITHQS
jgi:hypothetical protein